MNWGGTKKNKKQKKRGKKEKETDIVAEDEAC